MRRIRISLVCFAVCLGGCDTAYGIRARAEYPTKIDVECVDGALRKAFEQVHRLDFDGPKGTPVAMFEYYITPGNEQGSATLRIYHVQSGTHVEHAFLNYDKMPPAVFPPARAAMRRAGDALRVGCALDLSKMTMREVGFFDAFRGLDFPPISSL